MESKKSSKLPEGVGKKIVDALKKQSQAISEIQADETSAFSQAQELNPSLSVSFSNEQENVYWGTQEVEYEPVDFEENDFAVEQTPQTNQGFSFDEYQPSREESNYNAYDFYEEPKNEEVQEIIPEEHSYAETFTETRYEEIAPPRPKRQENHYSQPSFEKRRSAAERVVSNNERGAINLELSTNVEVLKRLIFQLPTGVTRQTGAQIIRTTMEAMGVSMNKVLTEAQTAQDDLQSSIRDTMNTIEEYRNNIRILEKEVQCYRKQSDELEDIISLFILSEKENKK